ncbi:2-phospho-L-lactate guanylyltransferase [Nocardioides sp. LHG3406-4]|uniref:2-phospho-L-lactate guanylyltransferase n=1 Tax=Nocardioides sp. LHG3406-4 TaxID=2804575 RepID=UPI003CE79960
MLPITSVYPCRAEEARASSRRPAQPWMAIVPQKSLSRAKSRLDLPDVARWRVARAMLVDTVFALGQVKGLDRVIIAWEDPDDVSWMPVMPRVVHHVVPGSDLNGAISTVEEQVAAEVPQSGRLVVPGDLPACSSVQMDELVAQVAQVARSFLRDAHGAGTTVLAARDNTLLSPQYGRSSARQHLSTGAHPLDAARFPSVTRDVDTMTDLYAALRLGVGRATRTVTRDLGLSLPPG